jgi:hypothetical protein
MAGLRAASPSKPLGVSREVVLRRLLILDRTTQQFYERKRKQFEEEYRNQQDQQEGFAPPYRMAITTAGPLFTRLVLSNYLLDEITASEVSE